MNQSMKRFNLALTAPWQANSLEIHCHCGTEEVCCNRLQSLEEMAALIWMGYDSWKTQHFQPFLLLQRWPCSLSRRGSAGADEPDIILRANWKDAGTHFCWSWMLQSVLVHVSPPVCVTMVTFRIHGPVTFVSTCAHEHANSAQLKR